MKILAISGSLRRESYNSALLLAAAELLPTGVDFELYENLKAVPPYDQDDDLEPGPSDLEPGPSDLEPGPSGVGRLRAAIADADALLIATPEYNSSIPGQLKNALDWASRPLATSVLRNKPVAVVGTSTGAFGAVWAQAELRKVLAATGARVLDVELAVGHAAERFDEHGGLVGDDVRGQLQEVVRVLLGAVRPVGALAA